MPRSTRARGRGPRGFQDPFQRRARRAHRPSAEHHPSRMRCATVCSREPGFARSATGTSDRPVQHRSMHPCRRASQNARLVRVSSVPFRRSSPDRSAARARSDRGPRCSSAARRARVIATGVPHAPCRGHVTGRRQPPAPCARVAVMSGETAPASRWPAPCERSQSRTAAAGYGLPRVGRVASAQRRLPAARAGRPNRGHRLANDCRRTAGRIGISMIVRNPSTKRLPTCGPSQRSGTYSGAGPPSKGCQVSSRTASRLISRLLANFIAPVAVREEFRYSVFLRLKLTLRAAEGGPRFVLAIISALRPGGTLRILGSSPLGSASLFDGTSLEKKLSGRGRMRALPIFCLCIPGPA